MPLTDPHLHAAAQERATRTFFQGLGIDVLVALATLVLVWLPDADITSAEAWTVLGVSAGKTILTTVAAYVTRLKIEPATETTTE